MPSALRIIPRASFVPKPWKNGGGVTYEAAREPAAGESYDWRVSVAHVDAPGPFSDFHGYDRKMVLLEGNGVQLAFADGSRRSLTRVGELAEFDGGLAADCTLVQGPCVDFNLIIAKSHAASVEVLRLAAPEQRVVGATAAQTLLIFAVAGSVELHTADAQPAILQPWDLALMQAGAASAVRLQSRGESRSSAVFFATISH